LNKFITLLLCCCCGSNYRVASLVRYPGVSIVDSRIGRTCRMNSLKLSDSNKRDWSPPSRKDDDSDKSPNESGLTFTVEMGKSSGISWGSDLSFRWIYVLSIEPNSEAAATNLISKGDYIIGAGNTSLIAQDFDFVISSLRQQESRFNYTFFRGSKEVLMGAPMLEPSETTISVTVVQDGKPDIVLQCPGGMNLRRLLVGNGINVYRSITRWTNCNGKQRCGTCIVDMLQGGENCSRRALDEEATLRENPENYRLCCVTSVYGDVKVKVQGAVGAAQWTR